MYHAEAESNVSTNFLSLNLKINGLSVSIMLPLCAMSVDGRTIDVN